MESRTQDYSSPQAFAQNSVNYQHHPNANLDMITTTGNTRRSKRKRNPESDTNGTHGSSKRPHISTGSSSKETIAGNEHVSAEDWVDPHLKTAMTMGNPRRYDLTGNASIGPNRQGVLENAQNVLLKNPHMVDIGTQNVFVNDSSSPVLPWLRGYTMPGAKFDSSARDPPPRCHPGTRAAILHRAQDWFNDSNREKKLLWLHGPVGVGKSAIVQTVAEIESKSQRLGATLFFSRSNRLNKPEKVFPTIAYQLAVQDLSYKAYIAELMVDPMSLDRAISEQFTKLIVEPFVKRGIRNGSAVWIIALDGLDECGGTQEESSSWQARARPGRHSDECQRKIVDLISGFVLKYPSVPLIWIIASRPEPHLKAVFSHQGVIPSFWEEDIPVDSDEACSDVEKYLRSEFDVIRGKYPNHISSEIWPSNNEFLRITKAASGLFAFAAVIILFIDDPWVANPVEQLGSVLSVIDKLSRLDGQQHPLAALDALYTEILHRIPSNVWPVTKQLLATSMLLLVAPRTLVYMCNVLDIKQGTAVTALRHLHSVIKLPRNEKIGHLSLKFYHASFKDYLKDLSRSHEYVIDEGAMQKVANEWWWGIFRITRQRTAFSLDAFDPELGSVPLSSTISFSWPPNKATEEKIMAAVGKMWRSFMLGDFQGNYYRIPCTGEQQPVPRISASDMLRIIERLDFSELGRKHEEGALPVGPYDIFQWLTRVAKRFPELEQRGILSYLTLGSLHSGSIYYSQVRCQHHSLLIGFWEAMMKEDAVKELQRCIELAPSTRVAIWSNGGRHCAVFKIKIIGIQDPDPDSTYIIIPDIRITRPEN